MNAKVADNIRADIRKHTGRRAGKGVVWPGAPISIFPLTSGPTLRAMVASGEVKYVRNGRAVYATFS